MVVRFGILGRRFKTYDCVEHNILGQRPVNQQTVWTRLRFWGEASSGGGGTKTMQLCTFSNAACKSAY